MQHQQLSSMSGVGAFPSSVTTSTTTTTTTTKVTPLIWFDSSYVHTRPGQLKVAAVVRSSTSS